MTQTEELTEYNLTVDDVAAMFKVDKRTIRRWINEGKLPAQERLPGTRKFMLRRADIDQALREAGHAPAQSLRGDMTDTDPASLLQAEATEA